MQFLSWHQWNTPFPLGFDIGGSKIHHQ